MKKFNLGSRRTLETSFSLPNSVETKPGYFVAKDPKAELAFANKIRQELRDSDKEFLILDPKTIRMEEE